MTGSLQQHFRMSEPVVSILCYVKMMPPKNPTQQSNPAIHHDTPTTQHPSNPIHSNSPTDDIDCHSSSIGIASVWLHILCLDSLGWLWVGSLGWIVWVLILFCVVSIVGVSAHSIL